MCNHSRSETIDGIYEKTSDDGERALSATICTIDDFMALISHAAEPYLEQVAQLSKRDTEMGFGKTIQFYVPLSLTHALPNHCGYCGFNHNNKLERIVPTSDVTAHGVGGIP